MLGGGILRALFDEIHLCFGRFMNRPYDLTSLIV